jgi:hypothetical protein
MSYPTLQGARASLREFAPVLRRAHRIVRFWSSTHAAWRYARVLDGKA